MDNWTVPQVCAWLEDSGFGHHTEKFQSEGITGEVLLTLSKDELKGDLGVAQLGERKRILELIQQAARGQTPRPDSAGQPAPPSPPLQQTLSPVQEERPWPSSLGQEPQQPPLLPSDAAPMDVDAEAGRSAPEAGGAEAYLAAPSQPRSQSGFEVLGNYVQEPLLSRTEQSAGPASSVSSPEVHALKVFPVPPLHQLEEALRRAPGGSGFVRVSHSGKCALATYADAQSAARAAESKGVWADGDVFATLEPVNSTGGEEAVGADGADPPPYVHSPVESSIPTPVLRREAAVASSRCSTSSGPALPEEYSPDAHPVASEQAPWAAPRTPCSSPGPAPPQDYAAGARPAAPEQPEAPWAAPRTPCSSSGPAPPQDYAAGARPAAPKQPEAAALPGGPGAAAAACSLFVKGLQPHSDASVSEWQRRALVEAMRCRAHDAVTDVALFPLLGAARLRMASWAAMEDVLATVGPDGQLQMGNEVVRVLRPGSGAASELVYAVPIRDAVSCGAEAFARAVGAELRSKGWDVNVQGFRGVCAITFPDPEAVENAMYHGGGIDLSMGQGVRGSARFFPRCSCFYLNCVPVGVSEKDIAGIVAQRASGASIEHCSVDEKDGTGILLVKEDNGADMVAYLTELHVPGGALRLSREQLHPLYAEQLPAGVTEGDLVRELTRAKIRPRSVTVQGTQAEIVVASAEDRERASRMTLTFGGSSVELRQQRAVRHPFTDSWYTACVKDLPPVDAIAPEDPVFHAAAAWDCSLWLKHFNGFQRCGDRDEKSSGLHGMRKAAMLATVQAVRRGQYVPTPQGRKEERAVSLEVGPPPTVFYNMEESMPLPKDPKPSPYTRVHVVTEDCLECAQQIFEDTREVPLVLNMASDKQTGGGFLAGDGAQEETIFRRSNYYRTLGGLDDAGGRSGGPKYPWPGKFCAAFSAGVTVFRGQENAGYPFMSKPCKLDFVAVAAERNPPLTEKGELPPEHVAILRRKIELIFLVAAIHRKRHLVLSALGCGAFHNPPAHVAEIFRAVLMQYGCLFKSVTFAIVEDHNSKGGNVEPFRRVLDGFDVPPSRFAWPSDAVAPAVPCQHGGLCRSRANAAHCQQFAHPPLCARGAACTEDKPAHLQLFTHRQRCEHGGECKQVQDKAHCEFFDHPQECRYGASCTRCDPEHLRKFVHSIPVCQFGHKCKKKSDKSHLASYRHPVPQCRAGGCCTGLLDPQHAADFEHGVLPLCKQLVCCSKDPKGHREEYAHLCAWGTSCKELKAGNAQHIKQYIHLSRPACRQGARCTDFLDAAHVAAYSHAELAGGIEWPREECRFGSDCHNLDARHRCEFMHPPDVVRLPPCPVRGQLLQHKMDLYSARAALLEALSQHREAISPDEAPSDVVQWVRQLRPLHRCKLEIFESMCCHGVLMSASHMKELGDPDAAVRAAQSHPEITALLHEALSVEHRYILEHVANLVRLEYGKDDKKRIPSTDITKLEKAVDNSRRTVRGLKMRSESLDRIVQTAPDVAKASLHLKESYKNTGIHYHVDEKMGTDQHIFSIIGPHTGCYYGGIVLVLKPEVMHHPDFFLTVNAATSYHSGRAGKWRPWCDVVTNTDPSAALFAPARLPVTNTQVLQTLQTQIAALQQRVAAAPWDQALQAQLDQKKADLVALQGQSDSTSSPESRNIGIFRKSVLHPSVHKWDRIVAAELASMAKHVKRIPGPVGLDEVLRFWRDCDSHTVIEGHLPGVVPMRYVERILVPGDVRLSEKTLQILKSCFGDSLKDVLHLGDIKSSREEEDRNTHGGYPKAMDRTQAFAVPRGAQPSAPLRGIIAALPGGMAYQQDEALMPLALSPAHGLNHLYLSAPAHDCFGQPTELFVTIATTPSMADEGRKSVTIFLTSSLKEPSMSFITTNLPKIREAVEQRRSYRIADAKHFNVGCVPNGLIEYHIELDPQNKTLTVAHAGVSAIFSPGKMEAYCGGLLDFGRKLFISLCTWEHGVSVSGISVRKDALPVPHLQEQDGSRQQDGNGNGNGSRPGSSGDRPAEKGSGGKSDAPGDNSAEGSSDGVVSRAYTAISGVVQSVWPRGESSTSNPREEASHSNTKNFRWQVSLGQHNWADMEEDVDKRLRAAQEANERTCRFFSRRQEYEVDLKRLKQVNLKTKKERAVRPPPS